LVASSVAFSFGAFGRRAKAKAKDRAKAKAKAKAKASCPIEHLTEGPPTSSLECAISPQKFIFSVCACTVVAILAQVIAHTLLAKAIDELPKAFLCSLIHAAKMVLPNMHIAKHCELPTMQIAQTLCLHSCLQHCPILRESL